ncbi:MAG: hypothetical protein K9N21_19905 [Deltaproteobacteria bacterium]|nr:hypothetical protein [Deltaproteobacteria bacterium]
MRTITPYVLQTRNLPRAVLKPPKVYFFDNGDVLGDEGALIAAERAAISL